VFRSALLARQERLKSTCTARKLLASRRRSQ
jgi:hypothetical protein